MKHIYQTFGPNDQRQQIAAVSFQQAARLVALRFGCEPAEVIVRYLKTITDTPKGTGPLGELEMALAKQEKRQ